MEIPIYSKEDLQNSRVDCYPPLEFQEILEELTSSFSLNEPANGIARRAIDKGTKELSDKQFYVLSKELSRYEKEYCAHCNNLYIAQLNEESPYLCDSCLNWMRNHE